ncbi:MAG: response regulator transcription factor [Proteobacteria bacterium]|nr:response regulator transcription factor [Pseudomonadota bacterium]
MRRSTVLLADDHRMLLDAFTKVLEPEFEIIGTVEDGRELLDLAVELKPDVIVLDISMPLLNGLAACERLRKSVPGTKLIFLTVNENPEIVAEAFRLGANGYLLKKSAASELVEAIRQVLLGRTYVTPLVTQSMVNRLMNGPAEKTNRAKLTPRQKEVVQLIAEGYSMKEVARMLDISPRTVAFHKYRVMEDQHLEKHVDLIRFAIKNGIISV